MDKDICVGSDGNLQTLETTLGTECMWIAVQVAFKQFRDLNDNAPSSSLVEYFQVIFQ